MKINLSRKKLSILIVISITLISIMIVAALNQNIPTSSQKNQSNSANPEAQSNPNTGTGILYAYTDPDRTTEVPQNPSGNYIVLFDVTYYFKITKITEYSEDTTINIWAHYQTDTTEKNILIGSFTIADGTILFEWTIPTDIPFETAIKFKYGTSLTGPDPSWYFAKKATEGVRLSFVIPEIPYGSLGAIITLISGLGITSFYQKRKFKH